MINAVFWFLVKVLVFLFCTIVTLAPICVLCMFCYGFYKDFLGSSNKK